MILFDFMNCALWGNSARDIEPVNVIRKIDFTLAQMETRNAARNAKAVADQQQSC
jgi:hypothetical protein